MGLLTHTFPNVQFIVSAHSPLIVAGCDFGEVSVLTRDPTTDRFVLETKRPDGLPITEHLSVQKDGVYRHKAMAFQLLPPVCVLKLPPAMSPLTRLASAA